MPQLHEAPGRDGGHPTIIAVNVSAFVSAASRQFRMPLPLPLRLGRLGRELRSEGYSPVVAWQNSTARTTCSAGG